MPAIKDQAICIRKQDYSESSQIVTLFGRGSGKIRAIAKGARRDRGKFGGGIDLLHAGRIIFIPARSGSGLATLSEFELSEGFGALRRTLLGLHCGLYAADLMAEFTEEMDPHEQLYDNFFTLLKALAQGDRPEAALIGFEQSLLQEVGLSPSWDRCCSCGQALPEKGRLYFSSRAGGMLCRECEGAFAEKRFVEPEVLSVLYRPDKAVAASRAVVLEAHELLSYHEREQLGKESKVMSFVNHLLCRQVSRPAATLPNPSPPTKDDRK